MKNISLYIAYLGTNYSGWQSQINAKSVSDEIRDAIKKITNENVVLHGSGRIDKGAHALEQVANFLMNSQVPTIKLLGALNHYLPLDIRILKVEEKPLDFHARYSAVGKIYNYKIYNSPNESPFYYNRMWQISKPLNVETMNECAKLFLGEHDFSSFRNSGSGVKSTIRTIYSASFTKEDDIITFRICGNGFLYCMVRIIISTLVQVGIGKLDYRDVENILNAKNRKTAPKTAPAHGLYMEKVLYENNTNLP